MGSICALTGVSSSSQRAIGSNVGEDAAAAPRSYERERRVDAALDCVGDVVDEARREEARAILEAEVSEGADGSSCSSSSA
jgi:hypothetical protein